MAKCTCNLMINELLTYVQNKIDVMDKQSLVLICIHSYNSSEIQAAKDLLMKTLSYKPINTRSDGNQRNMEDIIQMMKTAFPGDVPTFVARDLSKLPPIINTGPAGESHREDGRDIWDILEQTCLENNWVKCPEDTSKLKAVGLKNLIKQTEPGMGRVPQEPLTEKMENSVKYAIDQYIMNGDLKELCADVTQMYHPRFHSAVIALIVDITGNKNAKEVPIISKALVHLVATNIISIDNFLSGLKDSFELAPVIYIDVPMLYCYLGMIVAPHIVKNHITFSQIFNLSKNIISENQGNLLLKAIISNMCDNMGTTFVRIKWLESGMELKQWMEENQVSKWMEDNEFHFLEGLNAGADKTKGKLTLRERSKLLLLMRADGDCKCIQGWIEELRGVPNELTPQKFDTLLEKVEALSIDNEKRLQGVVDLIFEKAIEEPNFSEACAAMCSKLSMIKVPAKNATFTKKSVTFRALIISKCQEQFETKRTDERVLKLEKEIEACTDPGNQPDDYSRCTYRKLLDLVCQCANGLRDCGTGRGDRVAIYMPMILETVVSMLACARVGAVHIVVFAGFSADSLAERLADSNTKMVVTVDGAWRGDKMLYLKNTVDEAICRAKTKYNHFVSLCVCVAHLARVTPGADQAPDECPYSWDDEHDIWWHELMEDQSNICPPAWMDAEDPLFMLYTSGSTGKPKGVVHTTAGYLLYATSTFRYVFDYRDRDVYWCTADVGWITGHTYVVYAPLANAATSVLFEGTPFFPDGDRYWEIIDKYKVTQFYTAPTAIRSLMRFGDSFKERYELDSLRILGSVGEPINPEAWHWYYNNVGGGRASIVDTFWQTETGGHVLTTLPGATPMKPGAAGFPYFGVEPVILDEAGTVIEGPGEGYLVFSRPWPGMMRTLYNDHDRFEKVYFSKFPGYYCTGDGARRDADGYLWVTGRIDDMLNVSGHLMSTSEVESVLTEHPQVAEAAVVSRPHPIKGESLYCFVTLGEGFSFSDTLVDSLVKLVRRKIGAFAAPDVIHYAPGLPKTRSGKIMRRILRKIALGDRDIGDTSTLADPGVVEELFRNRPNK